ncbi:hypothetical protein BDV93DRAFT_514012 [Ceratobasidium sp. AG-I]|nr:hypothetical protein BDV93DRAFT_514012 [Ceratobasidium sp. AG-I]
MLTLEPVRAERSRIPHQVFRGSNQSPLNAVQSGYDPKNIRILADRIEPSGLSDPSAEHITGLSEELGQVIIDFSTAFQRADIDSPKSQDTASDWIVNRVKRSSSTSPQLKVKLRASDPKFMRILGNKPFQKTISRTLAKGLWTSIARVERAAGFLYSPN